MVTGLLKEETKQIYFWENYYNMISRAYAGNIYSGLSIIRFSGIKKQELKNLPEKLSFTGNTRIGINGNSLSRIYSELDWNREAENRIYGTDGSYEAAVFPKERTDIQQLEKILLEAGYQISRKKAFLRFMKRFIVHGKYMLK